MNLNIRSGYVSAGRQSDLCDDKHGKRMRPDDSLTESESRLKACQTRQMEDLQMLEVQLLFINEWE
jgi:hypothetical protein